VTETVKVKRVRPGAVMPRRATANASGFDIHACLEGGTATVGQTPVLVPTGLAFEVPTGLDAQLRPRSGLAKQGVLSTFGTLDADYRGELWIALYTTSPTVEYTVHDGDRIAQMVITRLAEVRFEEASELSETARGAGGHGSTGR
jgi:dUTP pyrophosphatase